MAGSIQGVTKTYVDTNLASITNQVTEIETDFMYAVKGGQNTLPKLITFIADDGRIGELDLGAVFIDNNVPLCGCIITGRPGTNAQLMEWDDIIDFSTNHGFEYGSHTVDVIENLSSDYPDLADVDDQLRLSKIELETRLGKPCNYFVYPQGVHTKPIRRIARKYYKASVDIDGGINFPPISMHPLWRENADGVAIATLQSKVDALVAKDNGWLIFMVHANLDRLGDYSKYDTLLKYIATQNIPVVTVSQALEYYGNRVDIGDFEKVDKLTYGWGRIVNEPHFMVDSQGTAYGNLLDMPTVYNWGGADIDLDKQPASYRKKSITYENVTDAKATSDLFPTLQGGSLVTFVAEQDTYSFQMYMPIRGGMFIRQTNAGSTWQAFSRVSAIFMDTAKTKTLTSVPSDFDLGITYTGGTNLAPIGYGTLVTHRSITTDGYTFQQFFPSSSANSNVYQRRWTGSAWSAWARINMLFKQTTAERNALDAGGLSAGEMVYDSTLNKPIWRNAANNAWVDATGTAV